MMATTHKRQKGRPSKIDSIDLKQVEILGAFGQLTEEDIAEIIGVSYATFKNYKNKYEDFLAAIKKGRRKVDHNAVANLNKLMTGFWGEDNKWYPPNVTANIFWLKSRCGWTETSKLEHGGEIKVIAENKILGPTKRED